jgi:hypothetical protein
MDELSNLNDALGEIPKDLLSKLKNCINSTIDTNAKDDKPSREEILELNAHHKATMTDDDIIAMWEEFEEENSYPYDEQSNTVIDPNEELPF